jgi:hypothetical protein
MDQGKLKKTKSLAINQDYLEAHQSRSALQYFFHIHCRCCDLILHENSSSIVPRVFGGID